MTVALDIVPPHPLPPLLLLPRPPPPTPTTSPSCPGISVPASRPTFPETIRREILKSNERRNSVSVTFYPWRNESVLCPDTTFAVRLPLSEI